MSPRRESCRSLLAEVRACRVCEKWLPLGPRPVLQLAPSARILIVGQAPGIRVHETGIPFNDPSGDRLRRWLGVSREEFYDQRRIALLPMGFCYPGTGTSGDLPPRRECAPTWRPRVLAQLRDVGLTVLLGQYAIAYHLPQGPRSVTEAVRDWRADWPRTIVLPHPSGRNNGWLVANPWFEAEVVPPLQERVRALLDG